MKTKQRVNTGFSRYSDEDIAVLAETIVAAMTGNENFVEPTPSLQVIEDLTESFSEKLIEARQRRSPIETAIKNKARVQLEKNLTVLATYVNKVANYDLAILLGSGFPLSRYKARVLPPEQVRNLKVKDGVKNRQMILEFDKIPRARMYEYRYSKEKDEAGEIIWLPIQFTSSSRNNLIEDVTPGAKYYFSVRAINTRGVGDWSEPVSWYAR